jgi:hypothetical protein
MRTRGLCRTSGVPIGQRRRVRLGRSEGMFAKVMFFNGYSFVDIPIRHTILDPRGCGHFIRIGSVKPGMIKAHPFKVSTNLCVSPSISNIFIVLSDEHVANRRP